MTDLPQQEPASEFPVPFAQVIREDLLLFALLHDRELDRARLLGLRKDWDEHLLGLKLTGKPAREALQRFRQGLDAIPTGLDPRTLDILAAEFADIYLLYSFQVSPCESVWFDEDGLAMQEPMFQIRAWYQRFGLYVEDWRKRPDDHLVTQLQFLSYLFEGAPDRERLETIARFLDEHLLRWIDRFGQRVSARCRTDFYAGLALLTAAYLHELRALLADLGVPRPRPEEIDRRMRPSNAESVSPPAPFAPGAEPSW